MTFDLESAAEPDQSRLHLCRGHSMHVQRPRRPTNQARHRVIFEAHVPVVPADDQTLDRWRRDRFLADRLDRHLDTARANQLTCLTIQNEDRPIDLRQIQKSPTRASTIKIEHISRHIIGEAVKQCTRRYPLAQQSNDAVVRHQLLWLPGGDMSPRHRDEPGHFVQSYIVTETARYIRWRRQRQSTYAGIIWLGEIVGHLRCAERVPPKHDRAFALCRCKIDPGL